MVTWFVTMRVLPLVTRLTFNDITMSSFSNTAAENNILAYAACFLHD